MKITNAFWKEFAGFAAIELEKTMRAADTDGSGLVDFNDKVPAEITNDIHRETAVTYFTLIHADERVAVRNTDSLVASTQRFLANGLKQTLQNQSPSFPNHLFLPVFKDFLDSKIAAAQASGVSAEALLNIRAQARSYLDGSLATVTTKQELRDAVPHAAGENEVAPNAKKIDSSVLDSMRGSLFDSYADNAKKALGGNSSDSFLYEVRDDKKNLVGYVIHVIASGSPDWKVSQLIGFDTSGTQHLNEIKDIS